MSNFTEVRAGVMPGRIESYTIQEGSSIKQLLDVAGLNPSGYEVKVDGRKIEDLDGTTISGTTNTVLLAKKVKGNGYTTVRAGVMPGRINEFSVEEGSTLRQVLEIAELNPSGYEVKVDGRKVDDLDGFTVNGSTNTILLAKKVKGNN